MLIIKKKGPIYVNIVIIHYFIQITSSSQIVDGQVLMIKSPDQLLAKKIQTEKDKEKKKRLVTKSDKMQEEMFDLMRQVRLKDYQVDKIVDRLKELALQVKKGLKEVNACEIELSMPGKDIRALLRRMRKSDAEATQICKEIGEPAETLLSVEKRLKAGEESFRRAREKQRHAESKVADSVRKLKIVTVETSRIKEETKKWAI